MPKNLVGDLFPLHLESKSMKAANLHSKLSKMVYGELLSSEDVSKLSDDEKDLYDRYVFDVKRAKH